MAEVSNPNRSVPTIVVLFFVLVFFFEPNSIKEMEQLASIDSFFKGAIILTFLVMIFHWVIVEGRVSNIILSIVVYQSIFLLSTLFHNGEMYLVGRDFALILGFCLFTEMMIEKNPIIFFKCTFTVLFIFSIINLLSLYYFYPNSMYERANSYFLGYYNQQIYTFIPLIFVSFVLTIINPRYTKYLFLAFILSSIPIFLLWSATSIVSIVMLSFFAFVGFRRNTHAVFNIRNYLLASVILFLCFVVFRVQYYFAFIIEQLLNRSLDFTYRTGIWDAALIRIRQNPIFGRGYFIEAINPLGTQTSAHNAVLSILLFGGFAALIVLLLILLSTSKKLMRYRNANISMILSTTLFVYTLQMLTEARIHFFFFALLVLANKIEMLLPLESQSAPQTIAASVKQFRTSSHNVR